jgi:hypothetical protein
VVLLASLGRSACGLLRTYLCLTTETIHFGLRPPVGEDLVCVRKALGQESHLDRTGATKFTLSGVSGPSGQHLIELIRHSDVVLEVLLAASGRQQIVAAMKLGDARNKIAEFLAEFDAMMEKGGATPP